MKHGFIEEHREEFRLAEMCEVLEMSRGGYYARSGREPSERERADVVIKQHIESIFLKARGRYGYRPIWEHLKEEGIECGRDRTLRLMKELGIAGSQQSGFKPVGTESNHHFGYHANVLKELGTPEHPDQVWVSDTTYLPTVHGWRYLATVMDLYSRRVIGWKLSASNDAQLVTDALNNAIGTRGGNIEAGIIIHSDRGSTYASDACQRLISKWDMTPSMSAKGNCYDNAAMESFYGRYKTSSLGDYVFESDQELSSHVFEYIEVFYNRFRKHSSLGYKSPQQFEEKFYPHGGNRTCLLA
ncbi:MAG: IS3 family transposase [Cyanobacteria bacterium P01_C01_bin.147]